MNRLVLVGHPLLLLPLSVSNANLQFSAFFHTYHSFTPTRTNSQICKKDQHGLASLHTTTTLCTTNKDLSTNKCVPCNTKELKAMTEDAVHTLLPQIAQWNLVNEGGALKLRRSWKVKTFIKGLEFFRIIADLAEAEGHHPDLHLVGWNNVTVEIWTHSVGNSYVYISQTKYIDELLQRANMADSNSLHTLNDSWSKAISLGMSMHAFASRATLERCKALKHISLSIQGTASYGLQKSHHLKLQAFLTLKSSNWGSHSND